MTGYGRGEGALSGAKVAVELSSVNRKQSEISLYLPRELEPLETRVREEINRRIARGRIVAKVALDLSDEAGLGGVELNVPLAKAYAKKLTELASELKLKEAVTLELLMRVPGVLRTDGEFSKADIFWPPLEKALAKALNELVRMREQEGANLLEDLRQRVATMQKLAGRIHKYAPQMVKNYRRQLQARIKAAGLEYPGPEDERLLKEVVYFADRSDISEELTRLQSHFHQFEIYAKSSDPVGRTLDFLAQEMNREINTMGAKATDSLVSREIVRLKAELEKFREQVQNVE